MNDKIKHNFNLESTGMRLVQLCECFTWSGITLISINMFGTLLTVGWHAPSFHFLSVLFIVLGGAGLGCLNCGRILMRTVYGSFPNIFMVRNRN